MLVLIIPHEKKLQIIPIDINFYASYNKMPIVKSF